MTAFRRAKERGFGIELDVRVSKDGEVVVFHDATLDRVVGSEGAIADLTLEELKTKSLKGTADTIPTLKEVLELIDGSVPLLIEIKEETLDHTISEKTAEILKDYKGDYMVESFSPLAFGAFKSHLPNIPRGFLTFKTTKNDRHRTVKHRLIRRMTLNFMVRPAFIAVSSKTPKMFPMPIITSIFKTPVIVWTVKSKEEERAALDGGASAVIFEGYIPD